MNPRNHSGIRVHGSMCGGRTQVMDPKVHGVMRPPCRCVVGFGADSGNFVVVAVLRGEFCVAG